MTQDEVEIWENTTAGGVWVQVRNKRDGSWRQQRIGGKNSPGYRIQLTPDERLFNQEKIPAANAHLDPFTNGHLVCVAGRPADQRGRYELSDDDLLAILKIDNDDVFTEAIEDIGIEFPLRRLAGLAEKHSTVARYNKIREVIDNRYRVGGTQRSIAEHIEAIGTATVMT